MQPATVSQSPVSPEQSLNPNGSLCHSISGYPAGRVPCFTVTCLGSINTAVRFLSWSSQHSITRMQYETCIWDSSSVLSGVLGIAWHDQPRSNSSQTADLAPALCDITRSHREVLTVSSPSSEPSSLSNMHTHAMPVFWCPSFSLPELYLLRVYKPSSTKYASQELIILNEVIINSKAF